MNANYKIFSLGAQVEYYFKERLNQGLTLTKFLKNKINLNEGKIVTFASSNLSKKELLNIQGSNLLDKNMAKSVTSEWLVKKIKIFLSKSKDNYCVFEVAEDYPQKNIITRYKFKNILFNGDPYYILNYLHSEETILEALRESSAWSHYPTAMGILTSIPDIQRYTLNSDITTDKFFKISAENTQEIFLQAYDQLGFVIWVKN